MPMVDPLRIKHRMAERGFADAKELAAAAALNYNGVRNGIGGRDPLSMLIIYKLARLLAREDEDVRTVVGDILADAEGVPDQPPHQPTQPKAPPRRQDTEDRRTGPKRARSAA